MRITITDPGARPPITTQAPDEGVAVGDYATGTCVTMRTTHAGRVTEIIPPPKYSGQHGNRYRIVDADDYGRYIDGVRKVDPVAAAEAAAATAPTPAAAATAALEAARTAGANRHVRAKLARAAYEFADALTAADSIITTDGDTITVWDRDTDALTDVWHCRNAQEFGPLTLTQIVETFGPARPEPQDPSGTAS